MLADDLHLYQSKLNMAALLLLLPLVFVASAITYKAVSILYDVFCSPLKNVPGPILARFTDLWYVNRI
jgi:hypothetical protein